MAREAGALYLQYSQALERALKANGGELPVPALTRVITDIHAKQAVMLRLLMKLDERLLALERLAKQATGQGVT